MSFYGLAVVVGTALEIMHFQKKLLALCMEFLHRFFQKFVWQQDMVATVTGQLIFKHHVLLICLSLGCHRP